MLDTLLQRGPGLLAILAAPLYKTVNKLEFFHNEFFFENTTRGNSYIKPPPKWQKMTWFQGATAKLGAAVDNELGGSAPHQCR